MLLIIVMVAYALLYFLLPSFYKSYKIKQYSNNTKTLLEQLENVNTLSDEQSLLTEFAIKTSCDVIVLNIRGDILFDLNQNNGVSYSQAIDEIVNENTQIISNAEEDKYIDLDYSYNVNDEKRIMQIRFPLQPLSEAKSVIINIFPIAGLLCLVFSFVLALIFSHSFVRPIQYISKGTRKMTELEPDIYIDIKTNDEIGELSHDINNLYSELRGTICALEKEIKVYADSENQKIDFLRTVSHELKTPLASANALIEGIIYNVPPYSDKKDEYLLECKSFIERSIQLTKESLSLSPVYNEEPKRYNLKVLIDDILSSYRVIIKSKQIKYTVTIPEEIFITTKINLFSKAISNVFSNAVNYTSTYGKITVEFLSNSSELIIENTCVPLSQEELKHISSPMYEGNKTNKLSNGLGLYIVNQSFNLLKLKHSFAENDIGNGMRYTVKLMISE